MNESPYIIDVTEENFEAVVIEGSKTQPVLVDFWAPWCNPCQMLIPVVSKLAEDYNGQFILAKINTDEQQGLARENGVKSLPTVKIFKNGAAVDEFLGALPEGEVKAFIDKHIEQQTSPIYEQAMQAYAKGESAIALDLLNQALIETPDSAVLKVDIANVLASQQDFDGALTILNSLSPEQKTETGANELMAQISMQQRINDAPAIEELEQRIKTDDNDLEAYVQLSDAYAATNQTEQALELLLRVMKKDRTFDQDAGRKGLINLFELLGAEHPLTKSYRRKMFSFMH